MTIQYRDNLQEIEAVGVDFFKNTVDISIHYGEKKTLGLNRIESIY